MIFITIMKLQNNCAISFQSGLTPALEQSFKTIDTRKLEKRMAKEYGIDAKFSGNKAIAGCFNYVLNLCCEASEKYKLPFNYVPPSIRLYTPQNLCEEDENTHGLCISERQKVLKDEGIFDTGSVFIENFPDDIRVIDMFQELRRDTNHSSTSHFLGLFLHEWFHNVHLNLLFDRFNRNRTSQIDQIRRLDKQMQPYNIIHRWAIKHSVSTYGSENKFELFSEVMSKIMADSIDENTMTLKGNPMEVLKTLPRFIQNYINDELK